MTDGYLAVLDALLADGLRALGDAFGRLQSAYAQQLQLPDGGFPGCQGGSDLYYTDFALRVLTLTAPPPTTLARAAQYLSRTRAEPRSVVECFSWLNSRRLLAPAGLEVPLARDGLVAAIARQALPTGGFAMPGGTVANAYQTFIAALCLEMLGEEFPSRGEAVAEIARLQTTDGGFRNQSGEGLAQTSATAAGLGFLTLHEANSQQAALSPDGAQAACAFLVSMQNVDGGLLAHPQAPGSDLLSTFTGLLSLALLDAHGALNLPALGRFVRGCASATGGFGAFPGDDGADLEYMYYGVGCVALLGAVMQASD